ncbi:MAG: dTDP-glucose 4,6-dehydratase [Syntrophus sp. (in: bacteria)]|nr:dTDP-glucose 4,6-dehydratase [Syntrophus sp. (in: bacteria)]
MKTSNLMVTGGCGFIGANFIHHLLAKQEFQGRIINVDKLTYAGNPENLEGVAERYPGRYVLQKADICDAAAMEAIFSEYQVDAICHFAAESHVDRSIKNPGSFIQSNIIGTFNLLEIARAGGSRFQLFHHISTDEVYGSLGPEGLFTEETPYRPNSPYSASKAASDHLVRAYHETFGLPTTISNCSNNYGPYQFPEKLIPLMIMNAVEGKPLPIYGDGKNVRDWLYVTDHCEAIWTIMMAGKRGETYNVGGDSEIENMTIVGMICAMIDEMLPSLQGRSRRDLITFVQDRPGHDRRYAIDFSKLSKSLGWRPQESFETGLRKTIRWYLDHRAWCERIKTGEYRKWLQEHYGQA